MRRSVAPPSSSTRPSCWIDPVLSTHHRWHDRLQLHRHSPRGPSTSSSKAPPATSNSPTSAKPCNPSTASSTSIDLHVWSLGFSFPRPQASHVTVAGYASCQTARLHPRGHQPHPPRPLPHHPHHHPPGNHRLRDHPRLLRPTRTRNSRRPRPPSPSRPQPYALAGLTLNSTAVIITATPTRHWEPRSFDTSQQREKAQVQSLSPCSSLCSRIKSSVASSVISAAFSAAMRNRLPQLSILRQLIELCLVDIGDLRTCHRQVDLRKSPACRAYPESASRSSQSCPP